MRYITPTPSLTHYSGQARGESSWYTGHGEQSWETGAAFGGPIVQDKLGFRLSAIRREQGGYIDVLNAYTGQTIRSNANSTSDWAARGALKGQINDRASAVLSYYYTSSKAEGGPSGPTRIFLPNGQLAPAGQTFTTPDMCVTATSYRNPVTQPLAVPGGVAAAPAVPASAVCTPTNRATALYVRRGQTYGPFATGPNIAYPGAGPYGGAGRQQVVGSDNNSGIGSLTLNYDFEHMNVKSITSYLKDQATSNSVGGEDYVSTGGAGQTSLETMSAPGCSANPCRFFPLYAPFPGSTGYFYSVNHREALEQELRFSSAPTDRPFSWVGGLYYSGSITKIDYQLREDPGAENQFLKSYWGPGENDTLRYGVPNTNGVASVLDARINDTEFAGFGEVNYYLTSKLKLIAGVRVSRVELDYSQLSYGQTSGRLATSQGSLVQGHGAETPITPKFGIQYQINDTDMVYFTAAKGFRAGGINSPLSQNNCGQYLAFYGLTADTVPVAYGSDSVWSYEVGSKVRALDNRLQVNAALYRIDWTDIQSTITLQCGQSFVTGAGRARSQGVDLQAQFRPITPLTFTLNVGYTEAKYLDPVGVFKGVKPVNGPSINSGDAVTGAPAPIQLSFSGQYDLTVMDKYRSYIRFDYTYQSRYASGPSFGSTGYNALTRYTMARDQLDLRAGVYLKSFEVNLFAVNALGAHAPIGSGMQNGRTCSNTSVDCSGFSSFDPFVSQTYQSPRRIGLQVNYKY